MSNDLSFVLEFERGKLVRAGVFSFFFNRKNE